MWLLEGGRKTYRFAFDLHFFDMLINNLQKFASNPFFEFFVTCL